MRWESHTDFSRFTIGRRELVLHRDIAPHAATILQKLIALKSSDQPGAGNRQSAFRLNIENGPELFARRARRGGMIAALLDDVYVGMNPRPLQELAVAVAAKKRGIPVTESMGAMVEWIGPALYRGFFLTRAVPGMTLWEFLQTDDDPTVREHVLHRVRNAIDTMHRGGLHHADLNLHNLLVTTAGESFNATIADLDKARLYDGPVPEAKRRENGRRLLRSARKLDPAGKYLDEAGLAILNLD